MKVEARRLCVPFNMFKPGKVDVYLIPSTDAHEGVPLAVLVDIESYRREALGAHAVPFAERVDPSSLKDWREWASSFGVTSKGPLVTYSELSRYGWGLAPYVNGNAVDGVQGRAGTNKMSYWTVFFAQNVMRGLCIRLIGCEMSILHTDAKGEEVYFKPWVKMFTKEVKSYKNIKPVRSMAPWVKEHSQAMWRRVGRGLTQDGNKRALGFERRHESVVVRQVEVRDAERMVEDEGDEE